MGTFSVITKIFSAFYKTVFSDFASIVSKLAEKVK